MKTISNQTYQIGDLAMSGDIDTSHSSDLDSQHSALALQKGDAAFVRRKDRRWTYAIVCKVDHQSSTPHIVFFVEPDGSTKRVDICHWGDRVRPLISQVKPMVLAAKGDWRRITSSNKGQEVYPPHKFASRRVNIYGKSPRLYPNATAA